MPLGIHLCVIGISESINGGATHLPCKSELVDGVHGVLSFLPLQIVHSNKKLRRKSRSKHLHTIFLEKACMQISVPLLGQAHIPSFP